MQIRFKRTAHGSTDGANRVEYVAGRTYETRIGRDGDDTTTLPESLAADFIRDGEAEEVKQSTRAATGDTTVAKGSGKPGPLETK